MRCIQGVLLYNIYGCWWWCILLVGEIYRRFQRPERKKERDKCFRLCAVSMDKVSHMVFLLKVLSNQDICPFETKKIIFLFHETKLHCHWPKTLAHCKSRQITPMTTLRHLVVIVVVFRRSPTIPVSSSTIVRIYSLYHGEDDLKWWQKKGAREGAELRLGQYRQYMAMVLVGCVDDTSN